jgi:hypothetical protein
MSEQRYLPAPDSVPLSYAVGLIDAWSRSGIIADLFNDAEANARRANRQSDIHRYRLVRDQFLDWAGKIR